MKKDKKLILIDLDGVLNTYTGNFDKYHIPDAKPCVKEFFEKISEDFEIKLFTTRNKILTSKWLIENKLDKYVNDITNVKELCWLYIDDRGILFDGDYDSLYESIQNFRPWYK